jgi:hypothetical protein
VLLLIRTETNSEWGYIEWTLEVADDEECAEMEHSLAHVTTTGIPHCTAAELPGNVTLIGSAETGFDCYGYGGGGGDFDPCCGDHTLPSTLYLSATSDSEPIQTDLELFGGQNQGVNIGGFDYDSADEGTYIVCIGSVPNGNPDKITISVFDPDEAESVTMSGTVLSCNPFHAVGSRTFNGHDYAAEITE